MEEAAGLRLALSGICSGTSSIQICHAHRDRCTPSRVNPNEHDLATLNGLGVSASRGNCSQTS